MGIEPTPVSCKQRPAIKGRVLHHDHANSCSGDPERWIVCICLYIIPTKPDLWPFGAHIHGGWLGSHVAHQLQRIQEEEQFAHALKQEEAPCFAIPMLLQLMLMLMMMMIHDDDGDADDGDDDDDDDDHDHDAVISFCTFFCDGNGCQWLSTAHPAHWLWAWLTRDSWPLNNGRLSVKMT